MSSESQYERSSESAPSAAPADHEIEDYTVGWVCALPLEMAAAKGMLERVHPNLQQDAADHNSYILGEVWGHNVAVACLPAGIYGTTSAATVASNMLRTFKSIRFGLMVGIGGGVPSPENDIRLGDIVVSQPTGTYGGVIQYDRGKTLQQDGFHRTGLINTPPQVLLTALSRLQAEHFTEDSRISEFLADLPHKMRERFSHPGLSNDSLFQANYVHVGSHLTCVECDYTRTVKREDRDTVNPVIHYGAIASGNQVIKDAELRDRLGRQFGALCLEMEAAGLQDFPSIVIRGISDYADSHKNKQWQFYAAATAAAFAKELLSMIPPYRVLQQMPIKQMVAVSGEQLKTMKEHLDLSSEHLAEHKRTNKILGDRAIDLHVVHDARYDSADVGESPRCERNTRVRTQQTIMHWADNNKQEYFFWIVGPAGTGKSTVIRSIADRLNRDNRLVAGYFFKRGEQGRNDTKRLFSTLAMQLSDTIPSFREALRVSLGDIDKDSIDAKDLKFQFEKLLKEPLEQLALSKTSQNSKVIVIDALDECERPEHLSRILAFLMELCNNSAENLQLRIFLTSRPDHRVIRAFESLGENRHICKLELHRMFPEDTKADIRMYLETKLGEIRIRSKIQQDPWPSVEIVDRLVDLATYPEPLFIYAATLIRFLYDERYLWNPNHQLKIWLNQCSDNASQLSQMYSPILEQIFTSVSETDFEQQLHFLNATVLAPTPLSLLSLASLLGLDIDDINCWLPGFYAVLDIPSEPDKPIRLLHKSFSDYLHSPRDPGHDYLRMDPSETHALLVDRCIQMMTTGGLKRDICGLEKLDATSDAVDPYTLNRCLPSQVQYACLYWVHHLQACENPLSYDARVYDFLLQHFLHWVEAMVLQKRLSESIKALQDLMSLIKQLSDMPSELLDFLQDANRTILSFGSIIESAPLQVYASLLLFSPESSLVRQRFWNQRLPALSHIGGNNPEWDAYLWGVNVPGISKLAFSPDGRFLASADDGVHLWNASTGTYFIRLEDKRRTDRLKIIQFSPDSQLFAAVNSEVLRVWDITTWEEMPRIRLQSGFVVAIAFSEDSRLLVLAAENGRIEYWDVRTGMHLKTIAPPQYHDHTVSLTFSPNCQFVALVLRRETRLWTLATGDIKEIHHRYGHVESLAFSPDNKALVTGICPWLQVWNTETGALEYELKDNPPRQPFNDAEIDTVAFSPDNKLLVSGSGSKVRLWNLTKRDFCDFHIGGSIYHAVFSPDCQRLATGLGKNSGQIKMWDIIYADRGSLSLQDTGRCRGIYVSPSGKLVLSLSEKPSGIHPVLQLWDASTGILQRTLKHEGEIFGVQFSRDSKSVKFGKRQGESYIWDITTGKKEQIHGLKAKQVRRAVRYSEDGQLAAVFLDGGAIKLGSATSGAHLSTIDGHNCDIDAIGFSPSCEMLAASSSDNTIRVWNVKTGELKHQFHIPTGKPEVTALALSTRATELISINGESIDRWSVATGSHLDTHNHKGRGYLKGFSSSPNLDYLAAILLDLQSGLDKIQLYYPGKGYRRKLLRVRRGSVVHIIFSPDNRLLSVASTDRTVRLWDVATSTHIKTFKTYNDIPKVVRFSQDGQIIAVASNDRTTRIWNTSTGSFHQMVRCDQGFLQNMILLPNELRILVSGVDCNMSWDSNFKLTTHSYDLLCDNEAPRSETGYCGTSLDAKGIWIMQDSEKLVLIPPEYRPDRSSNGIIANRRSWATTGTVLFIGTRFGRVLRYSSLDQ